MIHSRHGVGVELTAEQKQATKLLYGQRVVTIRMSPDIHQQLAEKAHDANTSMNNLCLLAIQQVLERMANQETTQTTEQVA